jgi:hypothetical protein
MRRFFGIAVAMVVAFSLALFMGVSAIATWPWAESVIKLVH